MRCWRTALAKRPYISRTCAAQNARRRCAWLACYVAKWRIRPRDRAIFPRKNSRSCCIFSASSTPQRTQTSASIVAEIKLNADVLVASLMRSLPKKSRAQRCARANFASRTVDFIPDKNCCDFSAPRSQNAGDFPARAPRTTS